MINFGEVPANVTLPIAFTTYGKTNGESITLTGLAVTDIEVYKGTSMTQRASDAGYVLMDTDGIDIDGVTGFHGFSIDLSDNTDSGFYAVGSFYTVLVSAVTIDSQTVNFIAATFRIITADQTGDSYARLGAPAGASVSADIAAIEAQTDDIGAAGAGLTAADDAILAILGTPAGATLAADVAAVKVDTAAILVDTGTTLDTAIADLPTNAELATALGTADDAVLAAISTLSGKVDTIDDFLDSEIAAILAAVDTEVAAIKAKTDPLTFTVSNVVDANIQRINDVTVNGDGAGTPWGP
jgi:hypothetical protein